MLATLNLALINGKRKGIAVTEIQITPKYRDVKPEGFYVYIHRRSTDGTPFYVGKGKGRRAWIRCDRSNYWKRIARKYGVTVSVIRDCMSENCSLTFEKILIDCIGIDNLINFTIGGEGLSGFKFSDEVNERKSISQYHPIWNDSGEEFRNAHFAAKVMRDRGHNKATHTAIRYASSNKSKSGMAYGYYWSRIGIPSKPNKKTFMKCGSYKAKRITCVTNGKTFNSINEAARWVKDDIGIETANRATISKSIFRGDGMAYGMEWRLD